MPVERTHLLEKLKLKGCGLDDVHLSKAEKLALHEFKTKVANLGEGLYSKVDPDKADDLIVKVVFAVIRDSLNIRDRNA